MSESLPIKTKRRFRALFETVTCPAHSIINGVITERWSGQMGMAKWVFRGANHFLAADLEIFFKNLQLGRRHL